MSSVREAGPHDSHAVAPLLGALGYPSAPELVAERLARLDRDPSSCVFVAEADGRILGLAALHVIPVIERDGATGRITAFVVGGGTRRAGVGRALIERVEAEAVRRGCDRLEVTSSARRDDAHRFYRQLGFEETPRRFLKAFTAS